MKKMSRKEKQVIAYFFEQLRTECRNIDIELARNINELKDTSSKPDLSDRDKSIIKHKEIAIHYYQLKRSGIEEFRKKIENKFVDKYIKYFIYDTRRIKKWNLQEKKRGLSPIY